MSETEKQGFFVKDQYFVDGVISCKFISSCYSNVYKEKIGSDKLKFELTKDQCNDAILNQLKNKEMYFLKKILESNTKIKFPLQIKTFLKSDGMIFVKEAKLTKDAILLRKIINENKDETSTGLSENVSDLSLKVKFDMDEKKMRALKSNSTNKLSMNDLMDLSKSENLKLRIRIECNAFYSDQNNQSTLFISGTLSKINIENSKMAELYEELKEKSQLKNNNQKNKNNLNDGNKLYISKYQKKSSTITNNIVDIILNSSDNPK